MTAPDPNGFAHAVALGLFDNGADVVRDQIRAIAVFRQNDADMALGVTAEPAITLPPEIMAQHAALFFLCDDKIARKIDHLRTPNGERIVYREGIITRDGDEIGFANIWNAKTGEHDLYEEILAVRDDATGFQGAAFYDHTRHRMTFNFGGTDFTNIKNDVLTSGMQMMRGVIDNRMTNVIPFTQEAMRVLNERHADLIDGSTYDLAGHSKGVTDVSLAKYCLETQFGVPVRTQNLIEPTGAMNAYKNVSAIIAEAENKPEPVTFAELTHGTRSYRAEKGTFIDWFKSLSQNVGDLSRVKTPGNNPFSRHLGAAFIRGFIDEARTITQTRPAPAVGAPAPKTGTAAP